MCGCVCVCVCVRGKGGYEYIRFRIFINEIMYSSNCITIKKCNLYGLPADNK